MLFISVLSALFVCQVLPIFLLLPGVLNCCKRKKKNGNTVSSVSSHSTDVNESSTAFAKHLPANKINVNKGLNKKSKKDVKQQQINKSIGKKKVSTMRSAKLNASKPLIQQKQLAMSNAGSRITPVSSSSSSGSGTKSAKSAKLSLIKLKEKARGKFASILEEDEDYEMSKDTKPRHCLVSAASHLESQQSRPNLWKPVHHDNY